MNTSDQTTSDRSDLNQTSAAPSQGLWPAGNARWYAALVMVAAVALGLRLFYLWQLATYSKLTHQLVGDASRYVNWGQSLAMGNWVGNEVFYQAPLYPYFLGVIEALWDGALVGELWVVRIIQCLLGTVGCVFLTLAGKRMFDARTGIVAGLMLACYPTAIFFDGLIQKSALDLPLLCLALWLLVMGRQTSQEKFFKKQRIKPLLWWAASGATLALLMLSRENALVFVAAATLWALIPAENNDVENEPEKNVESCALDNAQSRSVAKRYVTRCLNRCQQNDWRTGFMRTAVLLAALMFTLSPVIIRNKIIGGEFQLTTSQLGSNLYIGNHPGADGSYQPLRYGRGDAAYERTDAIELAQERIGKTLTPGQVSSYWTGQVFEFMRNDPVAFMKLQWRKTMLMANAIEITDTEGQYAYSDTVPLLRWLSWWNMGILLPLACAGFFLRAKELRRSWLLPLFIILYAASVIAFFVFSRYRLPVVPLLMLVAAAGLVKLPWLIRRRQTSRASSRANRRLIMAGCALVAAGVLTWWPMLKVNDQRAVSYSSWARASWSSSPTGKMNAESAAAMYRKVIAFSPQYAGGYYNLGVQLLELKQTQEAIDVLQTSLQLKPDSADAWNQLGLAYMQAGQSRNAMMAYEKALQLRQNFAAAHNNLGVTLAREGLLEQAEKHYRQAIMLEPDMAQAHNNLGTTLARQGDLHEAVECFETAIKLNPLNMYAGYSDTQANLNKARAMIEASKADGNAQDVQDLKTK